MIAARKRTTSGGVRTCLLERVQLGGQKVDREAGIIRGVKVLGLVSANGRRYLKEAVRKAAPLYEKIPVRTNHPKAKASEIRDVQEQFGWLENITLDNAGEMWGDLHILNPKTELAESVMLAAEKNPRMFGLSHNADGDVVKDGDSDLVREIYEVRSVDLVCDPATTNGLFEGKQVANKIKLREWISGVKFGKLPRFAKAPRLAKAWRRKLVKLTEDFGDDDMADGMAAPAEDAGPKDHEQALTDGVRGGCNAIIDQCLAGEMDHKEGMKKLKEYMAAHAKLTDKSGSEPTEEEDAEDDEEADDKVEECMKEEDDDEKKKKDSKEDKKQPIGLERGMELCEATGVAFDRPLLGTLALLPEKEAKSLLEREKSRGTTPAPGKRKTTPQSGAGGNGTALTEGVEDLIGTLRG